MGDKKYTSAVMRRYAKAKERRDLWTPVLDDVYRLVQPAVDATGSRTEGTKTDTTLYEGQGVRSLAKRRNRMHGQLYPPFEHFLQFEVAGVDQSKLDDRDLEAYAAYQRQVSDAITSAIDDSNFHIEISQVIADLLVSTGAIQLNAGDPLGRPLMFEAIPIADLVPEEGAYGKLDTVFRPRKPTRRDVAVLWPDAKFDSVTDWREKLAKDPDEKIDVVEAQIWNPETRDYQYLVIMGDGEHVLVERTYATKRIIVGRMHKFTGNLLGTGPAMNCRADLLTANKVKELTLKNASIAVTGIWQADDDGVLNPANIKLIPGTIIPKAVGSAGLQPLQPGNRFDVSQLVHADLVAAIRDCIEGPAMPGFDQNRPVAYAFMSAERDRAEVEVPEHVRIFYELDADLWPAVIDVLSSDAFRGTPYFVPTFSVSGSELKPRPMNPLVRLKRQSDMMASHRAFSMAAMVDPQSTAMVVDRAKYIRKLLLDGGFPTECLVTQDELDKQKQAAAAQQQAYMSGATQGLQAGAEMAKSEGGQAMLQTLGGAR